jgi:hypothetical protein
VAHVASGFQKEGFLKVGFLGRALNVAWKMSAKWLRIALQNSQANKFKEHHHRSMDSCSSHACTEIDSALVLRQSNI